MILPSEILTYEENLLRTMRGLQLQKSCKMIPIGDLCYLFIFDYVENLEGNSNITSTTFKEKLQELYEGITADLSSQHTSWKNVVNTRINLPQLLTTPPDVQEKPLYYNIFNEVRSNLFRDKGVKPYPSSTCVGTKVMPENFIIGMSVVAIYKCK